MLMKIYVLSLKNEITDRMLKLMFLLLKSVARLNWQSVVKSYRRRGGDLNFALCSGEW